MRSSSSYRKRKKKKRSSRKTQTSLERKKFTKAQFFLLTGFTIISIFYLVSRWMEPYTIIDISRVAMNNEPSIFSNIKQESLDVVASSKSCFDLVNNLEEFETYIEDYAFKKLIVYFDFTLETPCYEHDPMFPTLIIFDIELSSSTITVRDTFYGFWPPGSEPS
jgi:hypothetical protein